MLFVIFETDTQVNILDSDDLVVETIDKQKFISCKDQLQIKYFSDFKLDEHGTFKTKDNNFVLKRNGSVIINKQVYKPLYISRNGYANIWDIKLNNFCLCGIQINTPISFTASTSFLLKYPFYYSGYYFIRYHLGYLDVTLVFSKKGDYLCILLNNLTSHIPYEVLYKNEDKVVSAKLQFLIANLLY